MAVLHYITIYYNTKLDYSGLFCHILILFGLLLHFLFYLCYSIYYHFYYYILREISRGKNVG